MRVVDPRQKFVNSKVKLLDLDGSMWGVALGGVLITVSVALNNTILATLQGTRESLKDK